MICSWPRLSSDKAKNGRCARKLGIHLRAQAKSGVERRQPWPQHDTRERLRGLPPRLFSSQRLGWARSERGSLESATHSAARSSP